MIDFAFCLKHVRRMAGMQGWPFLDEAQIELARILSDHAKDKEQAESVITEISENWERCPAPNELRAQLRTRFDVPETPRTCRFNFCDGHGWVETFALHTIVSIPGGTAYKEKKAISREQYNELSAKIDWNQQQVYTGVKPCQCRSDSPAPALISSRQ